MIHVQVIGLPGSGKTTTIHAFLEQYPNVKHYDLCNYQGLDRERQLIQDLKAHNGDSIIESACGLSMLPSYVIRLDMPRHYVLDNLTKRDGMADPNTLSQIEHEMIHPDVSVGTHAHLLMLLTERLGG